MTAKLKIGWPERISKALRNGMQWPTSPFFTSSQIFVVGDDVADFACKLADEEAERSKGDRFVFPLLSRLPSKRTLLLIETSLFPYFLFDSGDGGVGVAAPPHDNDDSNAPEMLGVYYPGRSLVRTSKDGGPEQEQETFLASIAFITAVINQPRLCAQSPAMSRQVRRGLQRGYGFTPQAMTRVSWAIGDDVKAKVSRDPSFHKVPLHYRRGHERLAKPHYKGAYRSDAFDPRLRGRWVQWIDEQWVGHPCFGVKTSYHEPSLGRKMLSLVEKAS